VFKHCLSVYKIIVYVIFTQGLSERKVIYIYIDYKNLTFFLSNIEILVSWYKKKIAKSKNVFWRERRFQYFVLFYQFVSCRVANEILVHYSFFDTREKVGTRDRQRRWQSISEIHFRLDLWEILVISYQFCCIFARKNRFSSYFE